MMTLLLKQNTPKRKIAETMIKKFLSKVIDRLSYLHITERAQRNCPELAPSYGEMFSLAQNPKETGWYLMPAWANLYHDDQVGWPELKFCNLDGREYIYGSPNQPTPDYAIINDDWRRGSYNYFPPIKNLSYGNPARTVMYVLNSTLHLLFDLVPSYMPFIRDPEKKER